MRKTSAIILMAALVLLAAGCSQEQKFQRMLDKAMAEPINYIVYSNEGFSVEHPDWPEPESRDKNVEVTRTRGYCSVAVNTEDMPAETLFSLLLKALEGGNVTEKQDMHVVYSALYQNITLISDTRIYSCNGKGHAVSVICFDRINDKARPIRDRIFSSAHCEKGGKKQEQPEKDDKKQERFEALLDNDYEISYPAWAKVPANNTENVLAVSNNICTFFVNKYNALPKDLSAWLKHAMEESRDNTLTGSSDDGSAYYLEYEFPYMNSTVSAKVKVIYCNYLAYAVTAACNKELSTAEMEQARQRLLDSSECKKEYAVPAPEEIEQRKEEARKEEPGVVEEIEEQIVKTNAGEEFGIDEEMVVYFINSNAFFKKIMRDFPKGNLVFEDAEGGRALRMKVLINSEGSITSVEDGEFSDADVTLVLPLRDALNIFSNAQNINPATLISFAVNARTIPAGIKDEVIRRVLRGEYN